MTLTLSFAWWHIPAVVTVLALLYVLYWPADDSGFMGGVTRLFMMVPALFVSLLAWAVAGFFK
jgi:hypothetical protein